MTGAALLLTLLAVGGPAAAAVARPKSVAENIGLDNGLDRGDWGPIELCTDGSYAASFEVKYSGVGFMDDTSINAIRLYCQTPAGSLTNVIVGSEGTYGQWRGMRVCPMGEFLTSMKANVVPDMGTLGDDLGVDNLQMTCEGGQVLDGLYGVPNKNGQKPLVTRERIQIGHREMEAVHLKIRESAKARDYGEWGSWSSCSAGLKVCGLEVRLEDDHIISDDAGVSDVIMFCCN